MKPLLPNKVTAGFGLTLAIPAGNVLVLGYPRSKTFQILSRLNLDNAAKPPQQLAALDSLLKAFFRPAVGDCPNFLSYLKEIFK